VHPGGVGTPPAAAGSLADARHLVNLVEHSGLLPGIGSLAYLDIDSLLRPVYGHAKQGASFGHTKIAGRQVLRKVLSPLATTISTAEGAPGLAGIRLRARQSRLREGRGLDGDRSDRHRPRSRGDRRAAGAWRFGLRQQRRGRRLRAGRGAVLRWC